MSVIILPNAKNTQNLVLLQMSIALQCGHTFQLRYCFPLLTLPLCLMKVPSGSLNLLSKGDFWSLCRILGTFYNQPFQLFPLHLAGFRGDDASLWNGTVFGIQLPKRSQKLPHKQPQLHWLWDNRVRDYCSKGMNKQNLTCSVSHMLWSPLLNFGCDFNIDSFLLMDIPRCVPDCFTKW